MSAVPSTRAPRRSPDGWTRGVSIIEAILASLMLALLAIPIFAMLDGGTRIFARGDTASGLHQDLRATVDQMARGLRMAGYDPSATGSPAAFEVAGAATVRFIADVDADGVTDRIEYSYDTAARTVTRQFWRWNGADWGAGSGPLVVARNVDSLTLAYFDATDGAPAGLGDIRRVTISLAGSQMVAGQGLERYAVSSEARARNLL